MIKNFDAKHLKNIITNGNFNTTVTNWNEDEPATIGIQIKNVHCTDITPLWDFLNQAEKLGFKTKLRGDKIILTMPKKKREREEK